MRVPTIDCTFANGAALAQSFAQTVAANLRGEELAVLARSHNNANIVCIPARFISITEAENIVRKFLSTDFEGGRHATRVGKISC